MKTIYFDLVGGVSGDMIVAAFLDLGLSWERLRKELAKVGVKGYSLRRRFVQRGHIRASKFDVLAKDPRNYSYPQIQRLIRTSGLPSRAKSQALKIYAVLADAEVKVHGRAHDHIHFEQLGDIDSIVDVVSAAVALDALDIGKVYYGAVPLGLRVCPAVRRLLADKKVYFTDQGYENVTPTGMAVLAATGEQVATDFKQVFTLGPCGYGAGTADPPDAANVLAAVELSCAEHEHGTDEIYVLEANIDDMNPQVFDYLFERFFDAGALDVSLAGVQMKKNRPGFLLTVLSKRENLGKISDLVLSETTSSGVRFYPVRRIKARRQTRFIGLRGSRARVKRMETSSGVFRFAPEYDDCKALAKRFKIPFLKIYNELQRKAESTWRSQD